jgi:hypothetical protein
MTFEKSVQYKEALQEYQKAVFKDCLNPKNVIIKEDDEVYLFYVQDKVDDVFKVLCEEYRKQHGEDDDDRTSFPVSLGSQEPTITLYYFMDVPYRAIFLWYDHCEVPNIFLPK